MDNIDADFGNLEFNGIDAWDSQTECMFPHTRIRRLFVHIWADASGPTHAQRQRFRELKSRLIHLWPNIIARIAAAHERLHTTEEVAAVMPEDVSVHLGEHGDTSIELVIALQSSGEERRAFFIPLDAWNAGEAIVAE